MSETTTELHAGIGRRLAARMEPGNMLWRRWLGCWIDFLAVALLIAVVAFALLAAMPETVV